MDKLNKRVAIWIVIISLLTFPMPSAFAQQTRGVPASPCQAAANYGVLASMTAFGLAFIPGMQIVAGVYAGVAIGAELYRAIKRCG